MSSINLIESFQQFKDAESIDRPTLMKVLEDVFKTLLRKKYGTDENFDVIVNDQTGDLEIFRRRTIVEDGFSEDDNLEIELAEALKIDEDYSLGEEVYEEMEVLDFGRRAILAAKQTLAARISDLKKTNLLKKYDDRIGEIMSGEVYQIWRKELLMLDDEGNELILPKTEQIPSDFFRKGETIRAVIKAVEMRSNNPTIILSRTAPLFLERLLELEVPEIMDGLITVKKIVREPGERAKVAVESYDDRIDPVGACVGMKGSRIHSIVRELRNENIDIINYTSNIQLLIQRSLTPSRINRMDFDHDNKKVAVYLDPDQVSLAIGRKGVNIKLAQDICGYSIDVYRDVDETEADYDIDLQEFSDELEQWIIDSLKTAGYDTALSVLNSSLEEVERRADLERETTEEIFTVLRAEFSDEEDEEEEVEKEKQPEMAPDKAIDEEINSTSENSPEGEPNLSSASVDPEKPDSSEETADSNLEADKSNDSDDIKPVK